MNAITNPAILFAGAAAALARVGAALGLPNDAEPEHIAEAVERMARFHGAAPCPVTGEPFAGWRLHPERGPLPVYGHAGDRYLHTLPIQHTPEILVSLRFDAEAGRWDDAAVPAGFRVIGALRADLPADELRDLYEHRERSSAALARMRAFFQKVTALERGRDAAGKSLGPAGGMTWEAVGHQALDLARSALPQWCIYFAADHSVHAAPSREEAEQAAAAYNARMRPEIERRLASMPPEQHATQRPAADYLATVVPWLYSVSSFDQDVKNWCLARWTGERTAA